ncbi:MAG: hypothetical protein RIC95_09490 [Vicingaceae bacterium]
MSLFKTIGKFISRVILLHSLRASLSTLSPLIDVEIDLKRIDFSKHTIEMVFASLDIFYGLKDEVIQIFSRKIEPP